MGIPIEIIKIMNKLIKKMMLREKIYKSENKTDENKTNV
jgi:hypothetical protein